MTSSSAILYPSLKGMEQSNSSFVQVSPPEMENKKNLLFNHRNTVTSRGDKCVKSNLKRSEPNGKDEKSSGKMRHEYACLKTRSSENENDGKHENLNEKWKHCKKTATTDSADFVPAVKIDKSQQYSNQELQKEKDEDSFETASTHNEDNSNSSLVKSDAFQHFTNKPNPTIIINNTFIHRPGTEQDEFLSQFSQTFCNKNVNIQSIRDIFPSIMEQLKHDDLDKCNLSQDETQGLHQNKTQGLNQDDTGYHEISKEIKLLTEVQDVSEAIDFVNEINATYDDDISLKKAAPVGTIITAILWMVLILFWCMLYLKVLNVYKSVPNTLPKREPTNYEICLMFLRKCGMIFGQFWKFR